MTEMIAISEKRATESAKHKRGRTMKKWIGKAVQGVLTLFLVSLLIFFATQAMPGDVARVILGVNATPERLEVVREQLGLNLPLFQQYTQWLFGILRGDWGTSLTSGAPVADILGMRLRNSVTLGL
ncbi:MAG: hypothetical protein ACTJF6_05065, partial [Microbacteriaceae bacterium]